MRWGVFGLTGESLALEGPPPAAPTHSGNRIHSTLHLWVSRSFGLTTHPICRQAGSVGAGRCPSVPGCPCAPGPGLYAPGRQVGAGWGASCRRPLQRHSGRGRPETTSRGALRVPVGCYFGAVAPARARAFGPVLARISEASRAFFLAFLLADSKMMI